MTKKLFISTALASETLLGKSKAYIARALVAKARKELGEYQLWASLALELLGKAALSSVHPCLVAEGQSPRPRPLGYQVEGGLKPER
jgi:hypothetical protein